MNILDVLILLIMGMCSIWGVYSGAVISAINFASYFLSWLISLIFYPLISKLIVKLFPNILSTISLYLEGASKIPVIEDRTASIASVSGDKLSDIVSQMDLPSPFGKELLSNFDKPLEGIESLGQYVDYTLAAVIINIFSFILLFILIKVLISIGVSITKTLINIPVFKKHDSLIGAGFGLLSSLFVIYFVFALMPILMTIAPQDLITDFIDGSFFANFFHKTNIFTNLIRGRI